MQLARIREYRRLDKLVKLVETVRGGTRTRGFTAFISRTSPLQRHAGTVADGKKQAYKYYFPLRPASKVHFIAPPCAVQDCILSDFQVTSEKLSCHSNGLGNAMQIRS